MNNNVHVLPVTKKPPRRGRAPALPRAAVLQMTGHDDRDVETPEQRLARLARIDAAIDSIAEHLLGALLATRIIAREVRR